MNGKVVKIERINTRGVHMVEFAIFDISEKDFLSLQECINSRDDWEIEIRPTMRAVDDATRRDFERDHLHPYGYESLCGLCNPHRN